VTECVISNNVVSQANNQGNSGAGLYLDGSSNRVVRSMICNNQVQGTGPGNLPRYGAGVYLVSGELDRCVIRRNSMTSTTSVSAYGGGVYQTGGRIRNCLIALNNAYVEGGGLYATGGTNENNTVVENTVNQLGSIAGASLSGTTVSMTNCILVGNIRLADNQEKNLSTTGGAVGYSAMTPLRGGTSNVVADVGFMNAATGDYRLRLGSTGIDAGVTQAWMTGATELAGTNRVLGAAPDMGAYETPLANTGPLCANFTADATSGRDALNVNFTAYVAGSNTASLNFAWDLNGDGTADQEGSGLSSVSRSFTAGFYTIGLTVTNGIGESNTLVKTAYIRVYPSAFYVWSGGSGGPGTNWVTAYTNLATALPYLSSNCTMCLAGETMAVTSSIVLSDYVNVTIRGGYEATNLAVALPGNCDPARWSTIIRCGVGGIRPLYLLNMTAFGLANVTITGGNITNGTLDCKGGGLRVENSSGRIETCVFSNNVANSIADGHAYGGGVYVSNSSLILTNCAITSNKLTSPLLANNGYGYGGGLYLVGGTGTVVDCLISNNTASALLNNGNWAGGLYLDGVSNRVVRTRICNNQAQGKASTLRRGGGVYLVNGELDRCIIAQNGMTLTSSTDANGGGVYQTGGRIRNCLLFGNAGDQDGGAIYATAGTIESTTVSGNTVNEAGGIAGVLLSGSTVTMTNCISVSNIRLADSQEANVSSSGGTVGYSASTPLRSGTSNTADAVVFMNAASGDYRLRSGSAGIDAGITQVWMAAATDLAGTNRVLGSAPDMGAYETVSSSTMDVSFSGTPLSGKDSLAVTFTATVTNADLNGLLYKWDFNGDGSADQEGADLGTVTRTFSVGFFTVGLSVTNASGQSNSLVRSSYVSVYPSALYVWSGGSGGPGTNWSTAFTNISSALPFVSSTSTVYLAGQTLAQTSAVSLSGFDSVTILGGYEATNPAAVPGAYDPAIWPTTIVRTSGTNRVMDLYGMTGFRMARVTVAGGNIPADLIKGVGGGIRIQSSSVVIEDCVISNNVANSGPEAVAWGGGLYATNSTVTVRRSLFEKNSAVGSSYFNACKGYGGAIASESSAVTIEACRFVTNNADGKSSLSYGGALYLVGGTNQVRNSLFYGNQAGVSGNLLGAGGAVYLNTGTTLENCTVVSNQARNSVLTIGGGVQHAGGGITNCIVFFNATSNQPSNVGSANLSAIAYSCSPDVANGVNGNITNNPLFQNMALGNYRLGSASPCLNAGVVQPWMTGATDLEGNPRARGSKVDMGCYQAAFNSGTVVLIR
jgi:PKD repeat protein